MNTALTATTALSGSSQSDIRGGKYLTFWLAAEEYGIAILNVREIIALLRITPIPHAEQYIRGVVNLRGKVIPVIDLRIRFGMPAVADTETTCIIVVDLSFGGQKILAGLLVDAVSEVIDIAGSEVEGAPAITSVHDRHVISGIAKIRDKIKILLDIDHLLGSGDQTAMDAVAEATTDLSMATN